MVSNTPIAFGIFLKSQSLSLLVNDAIRVLPAQQFSFIVNGLDEYNELPSVERDQAGRVFLAKVVESVGQSRSLQLQALTLIFAPTLYGHLCDILDIAIPIMPEMALDRSAHHIST